MVEVGQREEPRLVSEDFGPIRLSAASLSIAGDRNLFAQAGQKDLYQQQRLLHNSGNCVQYLILNQDGKNMKKNIYMSLYLCIPNHFAVHQKLTQHCKSVINTSVNIFFQRGFNHQNSGLLHDT